jgi:hypothetical protein
VAAATAALGHTVAAATAALGHTVVVAMVAAASARHSLAVRAEAEIGVNARPMAEAGANLLRPTCARAPLRRTRRLAALRVVEMTRFSAAATTALGATVAASSVNSPTRAPTMALAATAGSSANARRRVRMKRAARARRFGSVSPSSPFDRPKQAGLSSRFGRAKRFDRASRWANATSSDSGCRQAIRPLFGPVEHASEAARILA